MVDGGASITWYGHACVEVRTPDGLVILFDPWFGNPSSPMSADAVDRCDILLVSHGHGDHIGDAQEIASRTRPFWPAVHEISLYFSSRMPTGRDSCVGFNKGGTLEHRGVKMTMVHAEHSGGELRGDSDVPVYLGEPAGFVVELADGFKFLFAGDTDVFGDMRLIRDRFAPTLAFLPIGGHYTMDPVGAALATELLGVSDVVPIHYGTFPILSGTPDQLRSALAGRGLGNVRVHAPRPGETLRPAVS
jgi:L-ascorbate metabolism protein UlaG (beta-lactamase superfamily)